MMSELEDIIKSTFFLSVSNFVANWYNLHSAIPLKSHSQYLKAIVIPCSDLQYHSHYLKPLAVPHSGSQNLAVPLSSSRSTLQYFVVPCSVSQYHSWYLVVNYSTSQRYSQYSQYNLNVLIQLIFNLHKLDFELYYELYGDKINTT